MPALSMFFGLIVYMYAKDNQKHHIPHIHVEYQDDEAVFFYFGRQTFGWKIAQ